MKKPFKIVVICLVLAAITALPAWAGLAAKPGPAGTMTLTEAVAIALKQNQSVIQADLAVDLAGARRQESQNAFNPQLALSESAGRQFTESTETKAYNFSKNQWQKVETNDSLKYNYNTKLALQLPLYTGHRLEANREQADWNVVQARANAAKVRQALVLDTTTAYFTLFQSYNNLDAARQSHEQMQAHLKTAALNYKNGIVAKSDVLRAEVELASAEQNLAKAENNVRLAETTLCNIMGVDLHTNIAIDKKVPASYRLQDLDDYLALAGQNRPELKATAAQVGGAAAAVTAAKSGYAPTVSLNGAYEWKEASFPPEDASWSITLNATWNAFDGGITASRVKQAQKNLGISQSQQRQLQDNVTLEVTQAYFNVQDAGKRLATAQKAADKAKEDFRIIQLRYQSGITTHVEVLDSHVAFLNAQNNFSQAQFDYHTSYARLLKAAGILDNGERMSANAA